MLSTEPAPPTTGVMSYRPGALVELAEGPRLLTNIVGIKPEAVTCDMPVKVVFDDVEPGVSVPKFAPLDAAAKS